MMIKKNLGAIAKKSEAIAIVNYEEIDNLKNTLKSSLRNKSSISKCQWLIDRENQQMILVKIVENNQALMISVPIASLSFKESQSLNNSNNEEKDNQIKVTLSIKELVEALEDKYLPADREKEQILIFFYTERGEVIIQQTQRCAVCEIEDISTLQIYNNESELIKEVHSKEDWSFKVVDNSLFTSLIKTISSLHDPYENFFIIKGVNKDTISLLFFFGDLKEENPQYYCTSSFGITLIKQSQKINCGLGIRYRTKEVSDFFFKYDGRKNVVIYSVDTKLMLTIQITKGKGPFRIQKSFAPVIIR